MNKKMMLYAPALSVLLFLGGVNPAVGLGECGPIDFVLVLDDTSSMVDAIGNIQSEAGDLVAALEARSSGNLRAALVTFKDHVTVDQALTRDTGAFVASLAAVSASGGRGKAEASDEALARVLSELAPTFRPGSRRIVSLVTDAPPGGPDGVYSPGTDDLRAADLALQARSEDILISPTFVLSGGAQNSAFLGDIRVIMERYASITGGIFQEVGQDGAGTAASIREVVESCGSTSCARRTREKILCTVDESDAFTYSFVFVNLGDEPVRHLFLLDPPDDVTFSPSRLEFDPPVRPGYRRLVPRPVRIEGVEPGQEISFRLAAHDRTLAECCSVPVTLELPTCDCGQVSIDDPPHCTVFSGPGPAARQDRFVFQNLFDEPVAHILVVPLSPPGVELVPNHFDLIDDPLQHGEQTELSVRIEGGAPGDLVCYMVSPHDAEVDDCCAIERCVELPKCSVIVDDLDPFGGVDLTTVEAGISITGFPAASSGHSGGIEVDTGDAAGVDVEWAPPRSEDLDEGAFLRKSFMASLDGGDPEPLAVLETVRGADGVELHGRFPALAAEHQTIELYREGFLVDRIDHAPVEEPLRPIFNAGPPTFETDVHYTSLGAAPITQSGGVSCNPDERLPWDPPCLFAGFTFKELFPWQLGFSTALVDEIRLIPEGGRVVAEVGPLSRVRIEGAGIGSLLIETLDLEHDCNRNMRADSEDIDLGASLDLDRDGCPDECDPGEPEVVILNTGFNQATGETLSPGSDDVDWTVSELGSHPRVVAQPVSSWTSPLPESAWISVDPERGVSIPGTPVLSFERCFCLEDGPGTVRLRADAFADDEATAFLNGVQIAGPGGRYAGPDPLEIEASGAVDAAPFQPGQNCLVIEVSDSGGVVTGLDLAGEVEADAGFCR